MKFPAYCILFLLLLTNLSAAAQSAGSKLLKRTVADSNIILPPTWAFGIMYGGYANKKT
ncbi:MAG: hypothetical protein IPK31_09770 [Chitinophagaceae bacterium]|nr:hypothetical protein [Chitinophagaceae bacterium]